MPCAWLLRAGDGPAGPREAARKGTGCVPVPVGIVLPLCLCQQVEVLVRH